LDTLQTSLSVRWQFLTPFYGARWLLKPWMAWLRGSREPAKFHLILGRKRI
jgi:hypothetical protein